MFVNIGELSIQESRKISVFKCVYGMFLQIPNAASSDLDPDSMKQHLQEKDLRIFAFYDENGTLTEKWRRTLVTAVISYLVEKKGL